MAICIIYIRRYLFDIEKSSFCESTIAVIKNEIIIIMGYMPIPLDIPYSK